MNRNALQLAEYTLEGGQVLSAETVKAIMLSTIATQSTIANNFFIFIVLF